MKRSYFDLIDQTYDFPQEGFRVENNELQFHDLPLKAIVNKYGSPLKITYLPSIRKQIAKAKNLFNRAIRRHGFTGEYNYAYCTKTSHFSYVMEEVLKSGSHLETSSHFDTELILRLHQERELDKQMYIICNGFKTDRYIDGIYRLIKAGFVNVIPVLDNMKELEHYDAFDLERMKLGIRIATEEQPNFDLYTSRFGIRQAEVLDFYADKIRSNRKYDVCMLHFFVFTGIRDTTYYWNELSNALKMYCELKKICPDLRMFDIGGGFPIRHSLDDEYEYKYMTNTIIERIKEACEQEDVEEPDIFSEFGTYTVGESGAVIFKVLGKKRQNDRETWYIVDNSIMTTLPDSWALNKQFILLPINMWERNYQRVLLGGLTCDNDDYYDANGQLLLPELYPNDSDQLYLGFFHTGAYQENLGGAGGVKHCLIPAPRHVLVDRNENGEITYHEFAPEQQYGDVLKILGY